MKIFWNCLIWFCFLDLLVGAVKNVILDIEPRVVQLGASALLRCSYTLEEMPLYTVKWYRGNMEFYRYTPKEKPSTKVFPFQGLDVDESMSDEHQVTLRNVDFPLAGNFSCEVSEDAPTFLTSADFKSMTVVVLPKQPPILVTELPEYDVGDILRAKCTSSPSKPEAKLAFFLNNVWVGAKNQKHTPHANEMESTSANLELQLIPLHFNEGKLILRCLAQVTELYQQDTELLLQNINDPIPEKVTSMNAVRKSEFSLAILAYSFIFLFFSLKFIHY